jgi:hypothetical protein
MCTPATCPAIEGGGRDDTFLARTIPQSPAAMGGGGASFFPFRGTRSLRPLSHPAGLAGAGIIERLQDSIRAMLKEARDDWTFVSVLSVANSPETPSTQPTVVIVLTPDAASVERAKAIVREVLDMQHR